MVGNLGGLQAPLLVTASDTSNSGNTMMMIRQSGNCSQSTTASNSSPGTSPNSTNLAPQTNKSQLPSPPDQPLPPLPPTTPTSDLSPRLFPARLSNSRDADFYYSQSCGQFTPFLL
ncbi:hypothetical protein Ciccas_014539 [Cichlidogyrus casuarinus]|uniref:Uncharacterized protein n=1 Tax=Cichlidogyrus casuarinus TaxID=1844966 RepID=A0ABD2PI26_9PLAT